MTKDYSWNYHENYKHRTWAEYVFHGNSMNNLLSYCGLIDTKIRASDKDLPVPIGQFVGVPVYTLFRSIFILIGGMH